MILLLGGTSETAPIAARLAAAGYTVLVSTATDEPLPVGAHPRIRCRAGRLDAEAMAALIRSQGIRAIVDATHPYAATVRATASRVARDLDIPYFTFIRRGSVEPHEPSVHLAADHEKAAHVAFSFSRPVLLTSGANNLTPYACRARETGLPLVARVLPRQTSIEACRRVGIPEDRIIAAKGPFSVEENREHIRQFKIGVVVTKDSGEAGGVQAKLEAARLEGCQVVVVQRPAVDSAKACTTVDELVASVLREAPAT